MTTRFNLVKIKAFLIFMDLNVKKLKTNVVSIFGKYLIECSFVVFCLIDTHAEQIKF